MKSTRMMLKFSSRVPPDSKRLERVSESGFRYTEIFLTHNSIKEWKQIVTMAESHDMTYGLHFPNRAILSDKQLEKSIKLYRRLNCESMVIHQPMFRRYSKQLLAIDSDLCLAVENHRLKPKNFWRWAESYPYLTLDVEHLWKHTLKQAPMSDLLSELKKFLKLHGSQLRRVHLPGYEPGGKEHQPLSFNPQLACKVFTALSKMDFQGLIVSESQPSMQKPKYLKSDVALYEKWEKKTTEENPQEKEVKLTESGFSVRPPVKNSQIKPGNSRLFRQECFPLLAFSTRIIEGERTRWQKLAHGKIG